MRETIAPPHPEIPTQNMHSLFDNVIAQWQDKGPVKGHLKSSEKSGLRQELSLRKEISEDHLTTHYYLDIVDEQIHPKKHTRLKNQVHLEVKPDGTEKATYRMSSEYAKNKFVQWKLTKEERTKLEQDLIIRSRWGKNETFNPFGYFEVTQIPKDELLLEKLGLNSPLIPDQVRRSVYKNEWYSIDNGKMILEVRNPDILTKPRSGTLHLSDFDDTIFSSTNQHKDEYKMLEKNSKLRKRGIRISAGRAEQIYQLSKILVPGFAEKEPRYTPQLNLALLTIYTNALAAMPKTEKEAYAQVVRQLEKIKANPNKEEIINKLPVDPDILSIFKTADLSKYLYLDFAEDFRTGTEPDDMRVIVTRGAIGGFLGQIHKLHACGILDKDRFDMPGVGKNGKPNGATVKSNDVELILYTQDLKAKSLTLIPQLFRAFVDKPTRIYDDNLDEMREYYDWARDNHLESLEMIRVRHADARRRKNLLTFTSLAGRTGINLPESAQDMNVPEEEIPDTGHTIYDVYIPFPDYVLPFPDFVKKVKEKKSRKKKKD